MKSIILSLLLVGCWAGMVVAQAEEAAPSTKNKSVALTEAEASKTAEATPNVKSPKKDAEAAGGKSLPVTELENLQGEIVSSEVLAENDGKPVVISFWATWCKPCIKELNAIHESYEDWVDETGVKVIAVSIDDARNAARVNPFINGRGWEYDVYLDKNSDFKRAMNVVNVPHTFLLNGEGEIVWQHNSYAPGDEEELYDKILELVE